MISLDWPAVTENIIAGAVGTFVGGFLVLEYTRRRSRADSEDERRWRLRRDIAVTQWQAALMNFGSDRAAKVQAAKAKLAELLGVLPDDI